jgi:glycosyltransferase involved in cell wall biosynthesis
MKPLRIAVVSSQVFAVPTPGYAGLEMVAYHCAVGLARRGHSVLLIAPDGSRAEGCDLLHTGPAGRLDERQAYDRYWQQLLQVTCVIDHSWQKNSHLLRMEGRLKAPVLSVMHAPVDTMYGSLPAGGEGFRAVCLSQDQASHFSALFGRPARVAFNGVDPSFYRQADGIPRTDRALFCARFSAIKGADIAVKACREAGAALDLVGDTTITNEPQYLQAVTAACDGEKVRMVGPDTRDGCVLRMSSAHVFLHPNERFREPFGLAPVEAMLCGLPVIAWRKGAMTETVLDGVSGRLAGSYDEFLQALTTSPDWLTEKTRRDARDWALRFSVGDMAARYEALCHEALSGVSGGW